MLMQAKISWFFLHFTNIFTHFLHSYPSEIDLLWEKTLISLQTPISQSFHNEQLINTLYNYSLRILKSSLVYSEQIQIPIEEPSSFL